MFPWRELEALWFTLFQRAGAGCGGSGSGGKRQQPAAASGSDKRQQQQRQAKIEGLERGRAWGPHLVAQQLLQHGGQHVHLRARRHRCELPALQRAWQGFWGLRV